jgi:hypothetical protein
MPSVARGFCAPAGRAPITALPQKCTCASRLAVPRSTFIAGSVPGVEVMRRTPVLMAAPLVAAALSVTGCSASLSVGGGQPSAPPSCTTSSCATAEIQRSLVTLTAKDGAAITDASCKPAKANPGGTWTASCTVHESDGAVYSGRGNLFPATKTVSFEPLDVITPPSG